MYAILCLFTADCPPQRRKTQQQCYQVKRYIGSNKRKVDIPIYCFTFSLSITFSSLFPNCIPFHHRKSIVIDFQRKIVPFVCGHCWCQFLIFVRRSPCTTDVRYEDESSIVYPTILVSTNHTQLSGKFSISTLFNNCDYDTLALIRIVRLSWNIDKTCWFIYLLDEIS